MAKYTYLDGTNEDGTILGQNTSALVAFWGSTPVNQATAVTAVATTAAVVSLSSSAWCYNSSAQANAIVTAVNAVITALQRAGFTA